MCFSIKAAQKDTVFLILPKLDVATLGFSLTDSEQTIFHQIIIKATGKTFKAEVISIKNNEELSGQINRAIVVFRIVDYYTCYHQMGQRAGKLSTRLYIFRNGQTLKSEHINVTSSGDTKFGWNDPFESALKANLDELRPLIRKGKNPIDTVSSLSDVLGFKNMYPCSTTLLVPLPDVTQKSMGYAIMSEESHDFAHLLVDSLSGLVQKSARIVDQQEIPQLIDCYGSIAEISVSHENNTISLHIRNAKSKDDIFTDSYKTSADLDWSDNMAFARTIGKAFTAFREKVEKEKVHF
jgi:hypothetical protein